MTDELSHQFRFRKPDILDRMSCEESILNVKEGGFGLFGGAAGNQSQIACFLRVAGEKHPPAAIGDTVNVVMARMDIQRVRRYGTRTDVKHNRQALARDRV